MVESISPQSVQRILLSHKLKPWRVHHWLSAQGVMDEAFRDTVLDVLDLYTRALAQHEQIWSLDEKTSLQPRTRSAPSLSAQPGNVPVRVEHEYARKGALQLFAAFNTQTGQVIGVLHRRKRQVEFIELLEAIDAQAPADVIRIHLVCDNVSIHNGHACASMACEAPKISHAFHASPLLPTSPTSTNCRNASSPSSRSGMSARIPSTGRNVRLTKS